MNRAKIGSLLFVGTVLFLAVAANVEGSALAEGFPTIDDEGPNRLARAPKSDAGHSTDNAPKPTKDDANALVSRSAEPVPVSTSPGIASPAARPAVETGLSAPLHETGHCGENMVEVEGEYCPTLEQKCVRWMDAENVMPRRCAEFAKTGSCQGKTVRKHFCIDRYEYPNKVGERPVVMKTWYEARDACTAQGKRLCGDSEWTLACEGQERLPYPYGHVRNAEACNIDKPHPDVNEKALANPLTRDAEVARLWQGEASGSRDACVSPYGAYDMTGNVDEWVVNESGLPYKSGLKGGYWGPVRDRCRPMTTAHFEQFSFYQIGFRCCSDTPDAAGGASAPRDVGSAGIGRGSSTNPAPSSIAGS